jgi:putative acetyltransferase
LVIREIELQDNHPLAAIIRQVLTEFGANQPGFAWQDSALDQMYQVYQPSNSLYLVVEKDGQLLGGAGIGPLEGEATAVCELQKMYLLPEARGCGLGRKLLEQLLQWAAGNYHYCYLETLSTMDGAIGLYQRMGFSKLSAPMGSTGHGGCDTWYGTSLEGIN